MFHASVGVMQKIDFQIKTAFGMNNHRNVEKSGFGLFVCVYVSACPSWYSFFGELSQAQGLTDELKL